MIRITNSEKNRLIEMGCKDFDPMYGFRDICVTYGHHHSYYLRETNDNINKLNIIRGLEK